MTSLNKYGSNPDNDTNFPQTCKFTVTKFISPQRRHDLFLRVRCNLFILHTNTDKSSFNFTGNMDSIITVLSRWLATDERGTLEIVK
jgi:hypothetical protein